VFVANDRAEFDREIARLVVLKHPCAIRILEGSDGRDSTWGEIQMELAQNRGLDCLLDRARRDNSTILQNPTQMGTLIYLIVLGMRYVHSRKIIHRDLKPAHILLDDCWRPKITDFGLSRHESAEGPPTAVTGTIRYRAPEQWAELAPHTRKTDVFLHLAWFCMRSSPERQFSPHRRHRCLS
jgi:serine/threonine protein kinase